MSSVSATAAKPGRWLRGRRRIGGVVAAFAVSAVAVLPAGPVAATNLATTPEAAGAAASGAGWLSEQLKAGIPLQVFGSPSWGATLDAASALAAVDLDNPLVEDIWIAATADLEAVVNDGTDDLPGRLSQMILLSYTLDKDPRHVGAAPGEDLVARLSATMRPAGSGDEGLFGAQAPNYDGVYRQGLALSALSSAGVTPDPLAIAWILDQQCVGAFAGAWMSYRSDTSIACVSDPIAWVGPDSNATAYALSGLVYSAASEPGVPTSLSNGLAWLDSDQHTDGGWGGYPWADTDPNSTAVVMQALIANNVQADARFADQSASQVAALLSFQLGAAAPEADRGAFTYPGTANSPSELATVQAVVAAAGYPLKFRPSTPDVTPDTTTPPKTPVKVPTPDSGVDRNVNAGADQVSPGIRPIRLAG